MPPTRRSNRAPAGSPAKPATPARRRWPPPSVPVVLAALVAYVVLFNAAYLRLPFHWDDYVIFNRVWNASFGSLWGARDLPFQFWRPWSRELHFWTLYRVFGDHVVLDRLVSWALWVVFLGAYHVLVRKLFGVRIGVLAVAGVAALAVWESTLIWIAGSQDLWLLVFAALFLAAYVARRDLLAAPLLVGALLSKESAAVLPAIAASYSLIVARERWPRVLARMVPLAVIVGVWAALHPTLRERMSPAAMATIDPSERSSLLSRLATAVASVVNLDRWPAPAPGWARGLVPALVGALVLAALAAWAERSKARAPDADERPEAPSTRAIAWGAAWAALGWLPVLTQYVGWHPYYALLGACGAWIAIAAVLARAPIGAAAIFLLALLQFLRAETPTWSWSAPYYQRDYVTRMESLRADLLAKHPDLPRHSTLYFSGAPSGLAFGHTWFNRALQFWYRDSTLRSGFFGTYAARGDSAGHDYFFAYDTSGTWRESVTGPEDVAAASAANPLWDRDHAGLANLFTHRGDPARAAFEWEKLAGARPQNPFLADSAAASLERAGDPTRAHAWRRQADSVRAARGSLAPAAAQR